MKEKKRVPMRITMEYWEFAKILKASKQPHHQVAFLLAFESGLRLAEVLALTPDCFNYDRWTLKVIDGKGGKDRVVNMPKHWLPRCMQYIPIGISRRALQTGFERVAEKLGIRTKERPVHFHTLRHGYATHLLDKGVEIHNIQGNLGHTDITTTMVYAHVNATKRIEETMMNW